MDWYLVFAFGLYFSFLSSVGIYFYFQNHNADDFSLGDRTLNFWVTAISAHASDMSAWLFMAYPVYIFSQGFFNYWLAIGLTAGMWASWQFIAPRLRIETEKYQSLTLISYFQARYQDHSGLISIVGGSASIVYFMFYIASGLVAMGLIFEQLFGVSYQMGIVLGMGAALLYTVVGGFLAVAWNDFFQGIFLLIMILIVPIYLVWVLGGIGSIQEAVFAKHPAATLIPDYSLATLGRIINIAAWGLGYLGGPHILVSFMAIDDVKHMRYAKYVGMSWQIVSFLAATAIGLVGIAYFSSTGIANQELLFVTMVHEQFHPLFAGFVVCGILAATISTLDTQLLLSASTVAQDFYKRSIAREPYSGEILWVTRSAMIVVSVIALCIASAKAQSVLQLVDYAWAGVGCSFGPLLLASLYWRATSRAGAIAGIVTGAVVSGIWPLFQTGVYQMIPGFAASGVAIIVFSLCTQYKPAYERL